MAVQALKLSNWLSRSLGRGSGTVAGGRVGLALDPTLLATLANGRDVALVSGTNGKTTTTRLLVAALSNQAGDGIPAVVASNETGANMPAGHVAAMVESIDASTAVLEVDEGYLARVVEETSPRVVVLLNLSRDQLDRISEVRMLVERWRSTMESLHGRAGQASATIVVANADDPMVVAAAMAAPAVRWIGAGQVWHNDAVGCPACGGRILFEADGAWACDQCSFARPRRHAWLEGSALVLADGSRHPLDLRLPGQFNRANAAMVAMAAPWMVADGTIQNDAGERSESPRSIVTALDRMAEVEQVAGRFSSVLHDGHQVRLMLAKNPAGWAAIFDLLDEADSSEIPLVLSINARVADGLDTSWLWDVPFERLAGRSVVATGDRRLDLAVRLRYAEVPYELIPDPRAALDRAVALTNTSRAGADQGTQPALGAIDFLGNYTAFADIRSRS